MFKPIPLFKLLTIGLVLLTLAGAPPLSGSASPLDTITVNTELDEYGTGTGLLAARGRLGGQHRRVSSAAARRAVSARISSACRPARTS